MEIGSLEMSSDVSNDQKEIEKHCKRMTEIKQNVFNSAEENIKSAQIRYKKDYDRRHAGRKRVIIVQEVYA